MVAIELDFEYVGALVKDPGVESVDELTVPGTEVVMSEEVDSIDTLT
jgi:hypothetical protein